MRGETELASRYRAILFETAGVLFLVGALFPIALLGLLRGGEVLPALRAFLPPALALTLGGYLLRRAFRPSSPVALTAKEGAVIVLITWALTCLASAFAIAAMAPTGFSGACLESVSGWTTTGLSVVDPERAAPALLLWRSLMQLAGGAGLAIIMLAALTGTPGTGLSSAEGRPDLLVPHVRRSAKLVLLIYSGYFVAGIVGYVLAGMDFFEAVNHSAAAVSTGGFSTRRASIGAWDSPAVEGVTLVLMVLGNLNFLTAWVLLRGRFREFARDGEVRLFGLATVVSVAVVLLAGHRIYPSFGRDLRVAVFECVSALTTTGFTTTSYAAWRPLGILILVALMWIGGGTCSTAGGVKQYRVHLLGRAIVWEVRRLLRPDRALAEHAVFAGGRRAWVDDGMLRSIGVFVFLYVVTVLVGSAIVSGCGYSLSDSLFEVSSAVGTVGLSVGVTAPAAPAPVLWTLTIGMFLGRLEFLVVFAAGAKLVLDLPRLGLGLTSRRRGGGRRSGTGPGARGA